MIKINQVSKTYQLNKEQDVIALKDINLKFPNKGMFFIVGKSGSGKSTLLNLIGGLDDVSQGEIEVFGHQVTQLTKNELNQYRNTVVGIVFQEYNLIPELNVEQNIHLTESLQGIKFDKENIDNLLSYVELSGYRKRKTNELSGGEKQRVAIARALAKQSKVILADEPTGSLDTKTGEEIISLLKKISEKQLVIVVSHDRELANAYGDQIIELKDGQIHQIHTINDSPDDEKTFTKLIKPTMPHRIVLKMSLKSLMFKISHFTFTVVLLATIMALVAIIIDIELYSPENYRNDVLARESSNIMTFYKQKVFPYSQQIYRTSLDDTNINDIHDLGVENGIVVNANFESLSIQNNVVRNRAGYERRVLLTELLGVTSIDDDIINHFSMNLLAGSLPVLEDEIAISLYTYWVFQLLGIKDINGNNIASPEVNDIIDIRINLDNDGFNQVKIVGIIDTGLDIDKYSRLLQSNEQWIDEFPYLLNDFNYKMNYEQHNLLYISDILLQKVIDNGIQLQSQPYQFSLKKLNQESNYTYIKTNDITSIPISSDHSNGIYLSIGKWLSYYQDKYIDLYVSYTDWLENYIKDEANITKEQIYHALIYYYEYIDLNEIVTHYDDWDDDSIYYAIYTNLLLGSITEFVPASNQSIYYDNNPFGETGEILQIAAYKDIIPMIATEDTFDMELTYGINDVNYYDVKLLGIMLDDNNEILYLSEDLYEIIKSMSVDSSRLMMIANIYDQNIIQSINHYSYSYSVLNVNHYKWNQINLVESNIQLYRIIFPGLLMIAMIIFTILFSQIIHLTILHHIKQIGVLVASGFKMTYVFAIYFYASAMIGVISLLLGAFFIEICLYAINVFTLGSHDLMFLFKSTAQSYIIVIVSLFVIIIFNIGVNIYIRLKNHPIRNVNSN